MLLSCERASGSLSCENGAPCCESQIQVELVKRYSNNNHHGIACGLRCRGKNIQKSGLLVYHGNVKVHDNLSSASPFRVRCYMILPKSTPFPLAKTSWIPKDLIIMHQLCGNGGSRPEVHRQTRLIPNCVSLLRLYPTRRLWCELNIELVQNSGADKSHFRVCQTREKREPHVSNKINVGCIPFQLTSCQCSFGGRR